MVADFLQQDLVAELKRLFDGAEFRSPKGEREKLSVFSQALPIPESADPPEGDLAPELIEEGLGLSDAGGAEPFPYIIVRLETGAITQIDGEQTIKTTLIFGAYDNSLENQGHKDVLHMIQKIYERFAKNAILAAKYECVMPINWALQDEESYPYYFGGMELNFNTIPLEREDKYT